MRAMYEAYVREGGPGRITEPADFTMLLATRLNFLLLQTRIALDPRAEQRHRDWAEREIDEALHILPTPRQLADVLELTRHPLIVGGTVDPADDVPPVTARLSSVTVAVPRDPNPRRSTSFGAAPGRPRHPGWRDSPTAP